MRAYTLLLFCCFILGFYGFNSIKKKESDFQKNFNIAKQHLSKRNIEDALPYLQYLNKKYPTNSNLKYLIGVCYAELEIINPETINLLNEASSKASLEYDPNSLEEERVPIYVYYYLSIAYSQNKLCTEAEKFRERFIAIYPYSDDYYLEESKRWLKLCNNGSPKPKVVELPSFPDFKPYVTPKKKKEIAPEEILTVENKTLPRDTFSQPIIKEPKEILTKKLEYSTNFPLYGVQLGAFKEVVPVSRFKNMKNVDAFLDKNGWIRYVIGHFSIYKQAESLLHLIQSNGYPDAFVVNVNNEKNFSDEIISVNKVNIKASQHSNIIYRVQIGAFKENIDKNSTELYLKIEGIKEIREEEMTYLSVGKFKTYTEAKGFVSNVFEMGIEDAFVIATLNGRKVPLDQANEF